jgi:hypothetical protein
MSFASQRRESSARWTATRAAPHFAIRAAGLGPIPFTPGIHRTGRHEGEEVREERQGHPVVVEHVLGRPRPRACAVGVRGLEDGTFSETSWRKSLSPEQISTERARPGTDACVAIASSASTPASNQQARRAPQRRRQRASMSRAGWSSSEGRPRLALYLSQTLRQTCSARSRRRPRRGWDRRNDGREGGRPVHGYGRLGGLHPRAEAWYDSEDVVPSTSRSVSSPTAPVDSHSARRSARLSDISMLAPGSGACKHPPKIGRKKVRNDGVTPSGASAP